MEKDALVLKRTCSKTDKFLENKSKRDAKSKRKWKPYKELTYEERKSLSDRESIKDHFKQVRVYIKL